MFILSFVIFKNIKYYVYFSDYGIVTEEGSIKVSVNKADLNKIANNTQIKINNKYFAYTIKSINESLDSVNNEVEIILDVKLPSNIKIANNILEFKILLSDKTILEYIIDKIGEL